jgi:hypothetical protein
VEQESVPFKGTSPATVESQKGTPMKTCPDGYREVFCRYIVRNGKRIYPKNARFFHFFVKDKTDTKDK